MDIEELAEPVASTLNGVPVQLTHRAYTVRTSAGEDEASVGAMLGLMIGGRFVPVTFDMEFNMVRVPLTDASREDAERTVREIVEEGKRTRGDGGTVREP